MKLMIDTAAGVALGGFALLCLMYRGEKEEAMFASIVGAVLALGLIGAAVWLG